MILTGNKETYNLPNNTDTNVDRAPKCILDSSLLVAFLVHYVTGPSKHNTDLWKVKLPFLNSATFLEQTETLLPKYIHIFLRDLFPFLINSIPF